MTFKTKIEMPWGEKVKVEVSYSKSEIGGIIIDSVLSSYGEKQYQWEKWLTRCQKDDMLKEIENHDKKK